MSIKYYYKCPKELGYLEITLDSENKIRSAIFVDSIKSGSSLSKDISGELEGYFIEKKNLPNKIISKEIGGTDFQKSVWAVIAKVPFGKTITYTEMAQKVGNPSAVRAAGTACGKNPLALFVPCHRVVRKQGEDYGYSWGPERKKWLLEFEKENI